MPNEPIVGIPEEMALAISKALDLCDAWQMERRSGWITTKEDIHAIVYEADSMIDLIKEALEDYNEA